MPTPSRGRIGGWCLGARGGDRVTSETARSAQSKTKERRVRAPSAPRARATHTTPPHTHADTRTAHMPCCHSLTHSSSIRPRDCPSATCPVTPRPSARVTSLKAQSPPKHLPPFPSHTSRSLLSLSLSLSLFFFFCATAIRATPRQPPPLLPCLATPCSLHPPSRLASPHVCQRSQKGGGSINQLCSIN